MKVGERKAAQTAQSPHEMLMHIIRKINEEFNYNCVVLHADGNTNGIKLPSVDGGATVRSGG